ncbi:D-alanine--poly(phosphoribitol) ligase subunit DltA [Clostridium senegalense]|uniref:D-alanine--poly(phosphoribitol) ligase subunit DltA n=1 Tax=Clostridium senegalense TaxID=1465809 RepID=UPI0002880B86|nr:D-alanine--poly(phosphoribitol) ligase subunit DltA [Clostridium senegalense]
MSLIKCIDDYGIHSSNKMAHISEDNSITYGDLKKYSDALANYLLKNYGNENTPILVYGHKENEMLYSFIGIVKSGHSYVPIDSSLPVERVRDIIEVSQPHIIISIEEMPFELENIKIINYNTLIEIFKTSEVESISEEYYVKKEDVYYSIFTSGSTGRPKGVQITLGCLESFVKWGLSLCNDKEKVFMNQAPFSFDLSVMDTYLSLASGSTLYSINKKMISNMKELFKSFETSNITTWVSTPSFADMCLSDSNFNEKLLDKLDTMLFCGETLTNSTVSKIRQAFPKVKIYNTYGPTESTVAITSIEVTDKVNEDFAPLPVGYSKENTWLYIMDENKNILPEGEKGEIIIVGDSVSIGYMNNEEINKKSFGTMEIDGKKYRMYKTGDKGYIKDNLLFYCGRLDFQVKLNGYRIELEDIENNIKNIDFIDNTIVLPHEKEGKIQYLIGVVTLTKRVEEKDFKIVSNIKNKLKEYIPEYMIPRKFIIKETLPMTPNGKVNRRALMEEMK